VSGTTLNDEWKIPESSLSERDADVLNLISQEALTRFTFDGLKRRLGLHSETLSRILGRLEQEGIVEKGPEGYKVTSKIDEFQPMHSIVSDDSQMLLQTLVPTNVSVEQLILNLKGKWFGLLRWLGCAEGEDGITLKWTTEDGGIQVNVNILEPALTIEAKFLRDKDLNMALKASYQLMVYIGKLCSSSQLIRRVAYFADHDLHFMPA
jgi:predicted transcriptional regulator